MAKDFDLHSNDKGKNGQRPPRQDVIPFDSVRRGRNDFQPIDSIKAETGVSRRGFWPQSLAGARTHIPSVDRYFMRAVYRHKF